MEATNRSAFAGEEEEERSGYVGPARRSLRRWARPAPYTPAPRRFASSLLPSRFSVATRENEQRANDDTEIAEIEYHLKNRTFTREEADRLMEVLKSRTPALHNNDTIYNKTPHFINNPESTLTRSLLNKTSWRPGDSIYSKAHATGSTPIEIAKSYMKSLDSSTPNNMDYYQTNRRSSILKNEFENSGAKSSIHWPGAVLQDKNIVQTPQSSEGNINLSSYNNDSHFSRSTFKVNNDRDTYDVFSTGKKRRLIPFEGSTKKSTTIVHEESQNTPKPKPFIERREYPLSESVPILVKKSSEKADKIFKSLERPVSISTPFKRTFLQDNNNQELDSVKEKINRESENRELENNCVSFGNQKHEMNKVSELKPALNAPEMGTTQRTGGSSFSFPVPNNKFYEPPTPTMPCSPSLPVPAVPVVPTFKFGSSSSDSSRLVFSFDSHNNINNNNVPSFGNESVPVFKFGSEQKRDLDFSLGTKHVVC